MLGSLLTSEEINSINYKLDEHYGSEYILNISLNFHNV